MHMIMYYRKNRTWLLGLLMLFLAAVTRYYGLGWSFWGDETTSLVQVRDLFGKPFFATQLEHRDLEARANPIGYSIQAVVYAIFGEGERGARVGVSTAGVIAIVMIFLLTSRLYGRVTGTILGFMLILSPWYLFHTQNNRNYSYAFLFGSFALLSAGFAWKHNHFRWGAIAGLFSGITGATHNFAIIIPAGLTAFAVSEWLRRKTPLPRRAIAGYMLTGGIALFLTYSLAWLVMRNWVAQQTWGYSSLHTLIGLAFNLDWGIALAACAGLVWVMLISRNPIDRLWGMVAITAGLAAIAMPFLVPFRHDYLLSVVLVFFMLAARFLVQVYDMLRERSLLFAIMITTIFLLLPLPSFISYYQDGDRHDYRAAAQCIKDHYQAGDMIAADSAGLLQYYLPSFQIEAANQSILGAKYIPHLEQLASGGQRLWLVLTLSRQEFPRELDRWLWEHAVRILRVKKKRFDYHENITDVYLITIRSAKLSPQMP